MDIPVEYLNKFKITKRPVFEYQDLCVELEKFYGKGVWGLPFKVGFTEAKIRDAHRIASERGIYSIGYLIGIIKNL